MRSQRNDDQDSRHSTFYEELKFREYVVQLVYTVPIASYQLFLGSSVGISDECIGRSFVFPKES